MKKVFLFASLFILIFHLNAQVTIPDSLEVFEEQREADFQEAREVFGESEVMKMFESLGIIHYFGNDYLH